MVITMAALSMVGGSGVFLPPAPGKVRFVPNAVPVVRVQCTASKQAPAGQRAPRGIMKPRPVSDELQALVGVPEIPRTQALKQIWAYIKEHNLQDPENKKVIVCDEKLKKLFGGKDRVGFLEISGLLNPHFR
ncbi:hypothetical protein H6P81_020450 [Aristolochia fimbriata]|uniref:DM2 domain-containing protein n=1 Tax=Aristolochia fimbriata TaxID=158543 RepID=A0AAV7DUE2_ARIFI|nr:hypothetical protein H6P81_020450 [Aristolochia fimbriata]